MIEYKCKVTLLEEECLSGYFYEHTEFHWTISRSEKEGVGELRVFFETEASAEEKWNELLSASLFAPKDLEVNNVRQEDWKDEYKKYLKPWSYGRLHWVPSWMREEYEVPSDALGVYLDAGMAFGTGAHETTQLCAIELVKYVEENRERLEGLKVIDAGCGSGVLAISARAMGLKNIFAFDIDPDVEQVFYGNLDNNAIDRRAIDFEVGSLEEKLTGKRGNIVFANIESTILCKYRDLLLGAVSDGGWLVLSGILQIEVDDVAECFEEGLETLHSQYTLDRGSLGEWSSLTLRLK